MICAADEHGDLRPIFFAIVAPNNDGSVPLTCANPGGRPENVDKGCSLGEISNKLKSVTCSSVREEGSKTTVILNYEFLNGRKFEQETLCVQQGAKKIIEDYKDMISIIAEKDSAQASSICIPKDNSAKCLPLTGPAYT